MSEIPRRCETCGNLIDPEDLFCSNCGREGPPVEGATPDEVEEGFVGFDCQSCGASMTYEVRAEGLRCSFCGSVSLARQEAPTGRIRAQSYLPFRIDRDAALASFRTWLGRGFLRPFGFREGARVVSMRPVYLPFWLYDGSVHTYYAADSSRTPAGARADWCPVFGEREGEVRGVLIPASGSLSPSEAAALGPFDLESLEPYRREALGEVPVEDFGLNRRGARVRAASAFAEVERGNCAQLVPGKSRNVHVNPLLANLSSAPILLPVWINAYRFRDQVYRFIINARTGSLSGRAPFGFLKLALILGVLAVGAAVVLAALSK